MSEIGESAKAFAKEVVWPAFWIMAAAINILVLPNSALALAVMHILAAIWSGLYAIKVLSVADKNETP